MPRMTLHEMTVTLQKAKETIDGKNAEIRGLKAEAQADGAQLDRLAMRCVDLVYQNTYIRERIAANIRYTNELAILAAIISSCITSAVWWVSCQ